MGGGFFVQACRSASQSVSVIPLYQVFERATMGSCEGKYRTELPSCAPALPGEIRFCGSILDRFQQEHVGASHRLAPRAISRIRKKIAELRMSSRRHVHPAAADEVLSFRRMHRGTDRSDSALPNAIGQCAIGSKT